MSDIKILNIQDEYIGHRVFEEDIKEDYFLIKTDMTEQQLENMVDDIVKDLRTELDEIGIYDIMNRLNEQDEIKFVRMTQPINIVVNF